MSGEDVVLGGNNLWTVWVFTLRGWWGWGLSPLSESPGDPIPRVQRRYPRHHTAVTKWVYVHLRTRCLFRKPTTELPKVQWHYCRVEKFFFVVINNLAKKQVTTHLSDMISLTIPNIISSMGKGSKASSKNLKELEQDWDFWFVFFRPFIIQGTLAATCILDLHV